MEIIPNGVVRLCANIPWDPTYSDVRKFNSVGEQTSYIAGKAIKTYNNVSYQRPTSSVAPPRPAFTCAVPDVADDLYNCNYIMFQNTNFGSKWFYGFVRQVNYVNPNCAHIVYEIDQYQTWCFDYEVLPSYVEREHAETDELYENLQPEPFTGLETIVTDIQTVRPNGGSPDYKIVVCTNAVPETGEPSPGQVIDNVYSGLTFTEFSASDGGAAANNFIKGFSAGTWDRILDGDIPYLRARIDAIVSIFMSPYSVVNPPTNDTVTVTRPTTLNGYEPKNKKLFTYPYCCLDVSNNCGQTRTYLYEKFTTGESVFPVEFNQYYTAGFNPTIVSLPAFYDSDTTVQGRGNADQAIQLSTFPVCGWSGDAFGDWLNNEYQSKQSGILSNLAIGLAGVMLGAATGGLGAVAGGALALGAGREVLGSISEANSLSRERNLRSQSQGSTMSTPLNATFNFKTDSVGITYKQKAIRAEMAEAIDSYFDMFGYATNKVKVPNEDSRPSWNYVKCNSVIIHGSCPVEAITTIKALYNNGVRFWHTDSVGNFSLYNGVE